MIPFLCTGPWTWVGTIGINRHNFTSSRDVNGRDPVSKETMERGSEASVTMITICVIVLKGNKEQQRFRERGERVS